MATQSRRHQRRDPSAQFHSTVTAKHKFPFSDFNSYSFPASPTYLHPDSTAVSDTRLVVVASKIPCISLCVSRIQVKAASLIQSSKETHLRSHRFVPKPNKASRNSTMSLKSNKHQDVRSSHQPDELQLANPLHSHRNTSIQNKDGCLHSHQPTAVSPLNQTASDATNVVRD